VAWHALRDALCLVVTAPAWLAANRILYTDLRGPNVLVRAAEDAEDVRGVDFAGAGFFAAGDFADLDQGDEVVVFDYCHAENLVWPIKLNYAF
jgi:hypothetical protein